jgi:hypothetical protein
VFNTLKNYLCGSSKFPEIPEVVSACTLDNPTWQSAQNRQVINLEQSIRSELPSAQGLLIFEYPRTSIFLCSLLNYNTAIFAQSLKSVSLLRFRDFKGCLVQNGLIYVHTFTGL